MKVPVKVVRGRPNPEIRKAFYSLLNLKRLKRVRILTFDIGDPYLAEGFTFSRMIKKLCAADVRVTIAIGKKEEKLEEETKKLLKTLIEWGVRIHCNDLIHAKVVLAEGEVKKALVMSSNVTTQGLHTNYEIGVCFPITKQIILERLRDYTSSIIGSEQTKGVDCNDVV